METRNNGRTGLTVGLIALALAFALIPVAGFALAWTPASTPNQKGATAVQPAVPNAVLYTYFS